MCGIAGIVAADGLRTMSVRALPRDARRNRPPRPRRGGRTGSTPRRARAPAAEHRRPRVRTAAARQRGRHGLDRLQRRDLQPRAICAPSSRRPDTATARAATPRRSSTRTRSGATTVFTASAACSRSPSGTPAAAAAARARSTRGQAALLDARRRSPDLRSEIKAILASGLVEPQANEAACPSCSARVISPVRRPSSRASTSCCPDTFSCSRTGRAHHAALLGRAGGGGRSPAGAERSANGCHGSARCWKSPFDCG